MNMYVMLFKVAHGKKSFPPDHNNKSRLWNQYWIRMIQETFICRTIALELSTAVSLSNAFISRDARVKDKSICMAKPSLCKRIGMSRVYSDLC